jgi:LacI family transcriptional regulator
MAKIVTIKDVARTAGASSMTVSRVLNDHPYVPPQTQKRIQGVIDELGYAPSDVACSLSLGYSNTIGNEEVTIERLCTRLLADLLSD